MNGIGRYFVLKLIVDALMTGGFLFFAYLNRASDPTLGGLVLGASLTYWLQSSSKAGQTIASPPGYSVVSVKGEQPPTEST